MQRESHRVERIERLLRHLTEGETRQAIQDLGRLEEKRNGFPTTRVKAAFVDLLRRRGFFVDRPAELRRSLQEIREVGEGFDLFDLATRLERVKPGLLPFSAKEKKRNGRTP
jgi:hypothetical protein